MTKLKFLLLAVIVMMTVGGCSNSKDKMNFTRLEDLNKPEYTIGAVVGAASEPYVGKCFPNAVEKQFPSLSDMVVALEKKQIDAAVFTKPTFDSVLAEHPNKFQILDEPLGETNLHMTISPKTGLENLQNEVNEFLRAKKADGTLEKACKYWLIDHNTEMPTDIPEPQGATKKLVAGTTGVMVPTTFYSGDELVGFDIEISKRFAAEYGYVIEYRVEDFTSLLTDAEFGKIDLMSGSVMYTEERAERVIFSETPLYTFPISVMVRSSQSTPSFAKPADLNDSKFTVGVVTGSSTETIVPRVLPEVKLKQFSEVNEMILALEEGTIDAGAYSQPPLETAVREHPDKLRILEEPFAYNNMHLIISPSTKIPNLLEQVDEFLIKMKSDGTIDKMQKYWIVDKNTAMPPIPLPENPAQKLTVGTAGTIPPHNFYVGNELSGFDIELIKRFAYEYNYELEFRVEPLVSQLADAEFGKIDMLSGIMTYTEERAERVNFTKTPLFTIPAALIVRNEQSVDGNFFADIRSSFEKTLIREDRYKMILDGLKVTLILSLGSIVFGTILGFAFCMIKRGKIFFLSKMMTAFIALISGLPIVLTLMICFYVIFSGTGLNEIVVAIIAFAIDFGCYFAIILNSGIESVDAGEIEAAQALGMSNLQIFRKIIFPQAVQKIFGVYKRHVISIIKATSVVGYIAVQDLTKVSDIIRARTYEAFFSLIFTAAIYFLIARLCIWVLNRADALLNRRKRNVEQ